MRPCRITRRHVASQPCGTMRPVLNLPEHRSGATMRLKTILIAIAVVAVSFFVSLKAMDWLAPRGGKAPVLVELPPLPPAPRTSTHHCAGRDRAVRDPRRRRPRHAAQSSPARPTIRCSRSCRTPTSAGPPRAGRSPPPARQDVLTLATPLTGTLNVTGSLSAKATGAVGDALGGLLGGDRGQTASAASTSRTSTPVPRSRATSSSRRGRSSPPAGASSPISRRRSISATPACRWPARASTCRRRSSR